MHFPNSLPKSSNSPELNLSGPGKTTVCYRWLPGLRNFLSLLETKTLNQILSTIELSFEQYGLALKVCRLLNTNGGFCDGKAFEKV